MTDTSLIERMERLSIASCTCNTKRPEWDYHDQWCHYRVYHEAITALSTPPSEEVAEAVATLQMIRSQDAVDNITDLLQRLDRNQQSYERQISEMSECIDSDKRQLDRVTRQREALSEVIRKAQEGLWWDGNEPFTITRMEQWLQAQRKEILELEEDED